MIKYLIYKWRRRKMKVKLFEVVSLNNGNLATIIGINKDTYKAELIDEKGKSLGIKEITNSEIKEIIYNK